MSSNTNDPAQYLGDIPHHPEHYMVWTDSECDAIRAHTLAAVQRALAAQPVLYSPIATRSQIDGKHPNDNEARDPARNEYLRRRGDDEGQGLCDYWKWGHAAGWNDHKRHAAEAAPAPEAPPGFSEDAKASIRSHVASLTAEQAFMLQAAQPVNAQMLEALTEERDALRRTLEIIAVGDSADPMGDAADQLVALGYWRAASVEQLRAAEAAQAHPAAVPFKVCARCDTPDACYEYGPCTPTPAAAVPAPAVGAQVERGVRPVGGDAK